MRLSDFWALLPLALVLGSLLVEGRLYCFRRLKRRGKCGGLIRRARHRDAEHCCSRRGQGFADTRVKLGRNKFRCTPCSNLLGHTSHAPASSPSGRRRKFSRRKARDRASRRTTTTEQISTAEVTAPPLSAAAAAAVASPTTATQAETTEFVWPTPVRRIFQVPGFPTARGDGSEEVDVIIWQEWSPCSVTCGAGWRSRAKVCNGCDHNDYENVQSQPCMDRLYCPVDGNWGPWRPWGTCSTSCSDGTRTRSRKCNYPPPAYGGAGCPGESLGVKNCHLESCPVDGSWGQWSEPSACSATCGPGQTVRSRHCDSPAASNGGQECQGLDTSREPCEVIKCPVDGAWSEWSVWGACSVNCGSGVIEYVRSCDNPRPENGGDDCQGEAVQLRECREDRPCPVDGGWTEWTNYGGCRSRPCSKGHQVQVRSCTSPRPAHGGRPCDGRQYDRVACFNDTLCPQNGIWCPWGTWDTCSATCGRESSIRGRQRVCACPEPKHGGVGCEGDILEVEECDVPACELTVEAVSGYTESTDKEEKVAVLHVTPPPARRDTEHDDRMDGVGGRPHASRSNYREVGDRVRLTTDEEEVNSETLAV